MGQRNIYRDATEAEYFVVGKFLKETIKIKKTLYKYIALLCIVLCYTMPVFALSMYALADELTFDKWVTNLLIMFFTGLIVFGFWFSNMRRLENIQKIYEKGEFGVKTFSITDRERVSRKRGMLWDPSEDYSEGRNRFYLVGKDSYGRQETYRVSGQEYKKSKNHKNGLVICWGEKDGIYGSCDLLIRLNE